jgi:hypothetical protein
MGKYEKRDKGEFPMLPVTCVDSWRVMFVEAQKTVAKICPLKESLGNELLSRGSHIVR